MTGRSTQRNHEGVLIDAIHAGAATASGIIIDPGGLTQTSVTVRDAFTAVALPVVEVHLSNVFAREEFRRHSYISPVAIAVITGAGAHGYEFAVDTLADRLAG